MAEPIWLGGIFLKYEGGYEIVIKALNHYRKRLRSFSGSPELQGSAAMFASLLNQEAGKTIPKIDETITKIHHVLRGQEQPESLLKDIEFLEKALACYQSDIQKAQDTGDRYFLKLVKDIQSAKRDLIPISIARKQIKIKAHI